jgi:uncharacterized membrane protein
MHRLLPVVLTGVALAWLALLVASPFFPRETGLVYAFAARICHQRPERSFVLAGMPMPVCARCAGLYASGALGAAAAWASARRRLALPGAGGTRLLLATAAAPTVATVALEWLGLVQPPNAARAIAALPLGAAAGWIFVRLLLAEAHAPQSLRYHA